MRRLYGPPRISPGDKSVAPAVPTQPQKSELSHHLVVIMVSNVNVLKLFHISCYSADLIFDHCVQASYSKTSLSGHSEKRTHSLERTRRQSRIENPVYVIQWQPPRSDHL